MKHVLACLLLLLVVAACSDGDSMRRQLQELQARNQADSLMTDLNKANTLCDYFDRHGTPNERMLAHYLLGRTHADLGEAPEALQAFHDAADCADTTASDCDYRLLCRIYGQGANIFYQQGLYRNQLEYTDMSVKYAWKGKDTIAAIVCYAQKGAIYNQLLLKDSAIIVFEDAIKQLKAHKCEQLAAGFAGVLARVLIEKDEIEKAKSYLYEHESLSGYFKENGDIENGREIYYYFKGLFYLKNNQLDSAEYFFRKELQTGKDFNNQNCGSRGLAQLYQQKNIPDSVSKYYAYSYVMNDSCFAQMTTHEVAQAQAMYDYTRQQIIAQQERQKAANTRRIIWYVIIIAGIVLFIILSRLYRKHKEQERLIEEHVSMQAEVMKLREHKANYECLLMERRKQAEALGDTLSEMESLKAEKDNFDKMLREKEDKIEQLKTDIKKYRRLARQERDIIKHQLEDAPIFRSLSEKAIKGIEITDKEWRDLEKFVAIRLPEFYLFVSSREHALTTIMYHVCILVRLQFSFTSISHMMGVKAPTITKVCSVVLKKLFNEEGSGKDLEQELIQFN